MLPPLRRTTLRTALFAALLPAKLFLLPAAPAQTQDPARAHIDEVLRGLARGRSVGQVAVSPDGKSLAWIQYAPGGDEIRLAPLADLAASRRITAAASTDQHCNENALAWKPDSAALAFLSDCARTDGQNDLYLAPADTSSGLSPTRRLTALHGYVQQPAFAPDGKSIAFLYVEGATRPAGALAAQDLPSGVIGEAKSDIQRIAVASADTSPPTEPAFASPANLHVYEFNWSPGSKSLAYIAADPPGENNWWVARLYTQQLGSAPRAILDPHSVSGPLHGLQIAVPRWSPDGKSIAFIGGLMSDQGVTGGDLWIVPSSGGQPVDLTPQRPASPAWLAWDGDRTLFVSELAGGASRLVRFALNPDRTRATPASTVFSIPGTMGDGRFELSLSPTADRSIFVFHASSFQRPNEIYAAKPASVPAPGFDALRQLSHLNDGVTPNWGKSLSINWTNEGFHVQGWLLLPVNYDPAKKYPLIVEVHGGPASAVVARWGAGGSLSPSAFSALGYFVLQPNPRGSFGQGEAFTQANRKDFGYGDLRDILAGVDTVEARFPIDPNRIGITGWSYGGFMTMFAVTQTKRFKAAVAGAGISDWLSYYGENSIDQWMIPYFGASVYDDPQVYARSAPINFIHHSSTPTLVVVGDRDGECPTPQSYEFWHALRSMHVPTQLVVYPNEGHGFVDPAHRRDVMNRAVEWFARYLPPAQ